MINQEISSEVTTLDPIIVDYQKCDFCGSCIGVCPSDCIEFTDYTLTIIGEDCIRCWLCIPACPVGALTGNENEAVDGLQQQEI